jgi:hypothetical protein
VERRYINITNKTTLTTTYASIVFSFSASTPAAVSLLRRTSQRTEGSPMEEK